MRTVGGFGMKRVWFAALVAGLFLLPRALEAQSYFPVPLKDAAAVTVRAGGSGGVRGDGVADDTAGLQGAIDQAADVPGGQGIVFLPEGRYRLTRTLFVWPGVRVIGVGAKRPTLLLGAKTTGYQEGMGYMVFFAGGRPRPEGQAGGPRSGRRPQPVPGTVPADVPMIDANPGTFYSAMSNVDFEMGEGNPAAVGIRFHAAQHCFLTHMEFRIGSGLAGLHDVGNEAEDLHFVGGQYGIMTRKPSPGWQFTLLDSSFDGQRVAAIKEHEAGLTMVGDTFRHVPAVVAIDPGYAEELWVKDSVFEDVSGPAVTISNEENLRTEINLENIRCVRVPVFARLRESGKEIKSGDASYVVKSYSHGMVVQSGSAHPDAEARIETNAVLSSVPQSVTDVTERVVRDLPARGTWVNLRELGAKGDGVADDTAVLKRAIAEHDTIYLPIGVYRVTETIALRPETVLIGLHPSRTQLYLADETAAFQGTGGPVPLLETPKGGHNIVTGIGLNTNGINARAVGALWQAGADSLMDDVRFLGGHGTNGLNGMRLNPYNNTHTADPDARRRWDSQYPSLWVTNGGGGTFADIWTPSTFAQAGMLVSDTETRGRVFELSSEHHVRNEVRVERASNWELYALQTEEERGEGPFCLPLEILDSKHITVANYHSYRVVSLFQPFEGAVHIARSEDVRLRNVHVYADNKASFNNAVVLGDGTQVRQREFAVMNVPDSVTQEKAAPAEKAATGSASRVQRLATGFYNLSGGAVDGQGRPYFVDAHWQRIYRWSPERRETEMVRDAPLEPVNLAIDKAGDVMVVSYAGKGGTVYSFKPDAPLDQVTMLSPVKSERRAEATAVLPVNFWRNENDFLEAVPVQKAFQFVSPDGSMFLPVGAEFVNGELYYGTKMSDVVRAFGFQKAEPGKPFYVTDESEEKTYSGTVGEDGTLGAVKLFAERGGENVAWDAKGEVYVAAGQIYVYRADGRLREVIEMPERPIQLLVGGKDGRTLYVLARTSLYAVSLP